MIKKFIIVPILTASIALNALPLQSSQMPSADYSANGERSQGGHFNTRAEYGTFESELHALYRASQSPAVAFQLGVFYSTDKTIGNSIVVAADENRAKYYFKEALSGGVYIAQYYLALISINNGNLDEAIIEMDVVLGKMLKELNIEYVDANYVSIASLYASVILDNFDNEILYKKAITYIFPVAYNYNFASAQYLLANLYKRIKYDEKANYYLNAACTNQNADKGVLERCEVFKSIARSKVE